MAVMREACLLTALSPPPPCSPPCSPPPREDATGPDIMCALLEAAYLRQAIQERVADAAGSKGRRRGKLVR